ncbi:nuclear transcription factor Y subunit beta isoform X1 [Gopherus flavomarginatus]|uniref:nuclear transcription factor Y subunit beta isoform X1 n=1 Tax=Gopherus flavomarginatus TaxID=286002 RepID=UPI0021CB9EE7|nr:nuclear transcription factor Y subunit beta isoform X1 [Gopherus flavomarginatus]
MKCPSPSPGPGAAAEGTRKWGEEPGPRQRPLASLCGRSRDGRGRSRQGQAEGDGTEAAPPSRWPGFWGHRGRYSGSILWARAAGARLPGLPLLRTRVRAPAPPRSQRGLGAAIPLCPPPGSPRPWLRCPAAGRERGSPPSNPGRVPFAPSPALQRGDLGLRGLGAACGILGGEGATFSAHPRQPRPRLLSVREVRAPDAATAAPRPPAPPPPAVPTLCPSADWEDGGVGVVRISVILGSARTTRLLCMGTQQLTLQSSHGTPLFIVIFTLECDLHVVLHPLLWTRASMFVVQT